MQSPLRICIHRIGFLLWIDYPADGMSFSLGTIDVQSHSTGPTSITRVGLYVDGALSRSDINTDPSAELVPMSQPWAADAPGVYTLQVRATDSSGNVSSSLPIHIVIGGCAAPGSGAAASCEELPTPTPVPIEVVIPAPTPTPTPTPMTAPSVEAVSCTEPTASFVVGANCRAGPSTDYDAVDAVPSGQSAPIVGRNEDSSWYLVRPSDGGSCWVSAVTVSVCGDVESVAVAGAPPLLVPPTEPPATEPPALAKPAAPQALAVVDHVCQGSTYAVTLGWKDAADNEDGYRVYRGNKVIANLGPNADSYTDKPPPGGPYTYKVEPYNGAGASSATTQDAGCIF
jgi:hypothetical protein